jgi:hypothetical protein
MPQPDTLAPSRDLRVAGALHNRTVPQWFCLLAGVVLLIRGVSVFVTGPGFELPGEGWHATFHLASGAVLMAAAFGTPALAYRVVVGFALAYGFVAVVGAVDGQDVLGVIPVDTRDNVVHGVYVALALAVIALGAGRKVRAR